MISGISFQTNTVSLTKQTSSSKGSLKNSFDFASYLTSTSLNNANLFALSPENTYEQSKLYHKPFKTPTIGDYLQNNFQAHQLKIISAAKERLQAEVTAYESTVKDSSITTQQKLTTMKRNSAILSDYLKQSQLKQTIISSNDFRF